MPVPYNINPTTRGVNGFALQACKDNYTVTFAAATEATVTVPSSNPLGALGMIGSPTDPTTAVAHNKWIAIFSYGVKTPADVFVALNATAAVPAGATLAASNSQLNPTAWNVQAGDVIHAITATVGGEMSISFYAIQE
ncbi:MAG: hypothetical protein KIH63_004740 [Candidatus Saccharibacteria bacterium]|nr:hypothetical protein [Candidatus Saccharibacteria bacterium]